MTRPLLCIVLFLLYTVYAQQGLFFGGNNFPVPPPSRKQPFKQTNLKRAPLIFAGGLGGSGIMFKKQNVKDEPGYFCYSTTKNYYQAWFDISGIIPYLSQPCLLHDLQLFFLNGSLYNRPGILSKPKDFGGIDGVAYIGTGYGKEHTAYAVWLIDYLVKNAGYQPGVDLRGATYDWRLGPNEYRRTGGSFEQFKALVEDTYKTNNNVRVHVAGHSMGGPFIQTFLSTYVDQQWKDTYINSFISLAGPYGGAPITLLQIAQGTNFGISLFDTQTMKRVIRRLGSPVWMLPSETNTDIMFSTPQKNYTGTHMKEFFYDMNDTVLYDLYRAEKQAGDMTLPPGVPTWCLYGFDIPTILSVSMSSVDPPTTEVPKVTGVGMGDQTVPLYSLAICDGWAKQQTQPVIVERFTNVTHGTIMFEQIALKKILQIVTNL